MYRDEEQWRNIFVQPSCFFPFPRKGENIQTSRPVEFCRGKVHPVYDDGLGVKLLSSLSTFSLTRAQLSRSIFIEKCCEMIARFSISGTSNAKNRSRVDLKIECGAIGALSSSRDLTTTAPNSSYVRVKSISLASLWIVTNTWTTSSTKPCIRATTKKKKCLPPTSSPSVNSPPPPQPLLRRRRRQSALLRENQVPRHSHRWHRKQFRPAIYSTLRNYSPLSFEKRRESPRLSPAAATAASLETVRARVASDTTRVREWSSVLHGEEEEKDPLCFRKPSSVWERF